MQIKVMYSEAQLHETALFIWENNLHVKDWPSTPKSSIDVLKYIREFMNSIVEQNVAILKEERSTGKESNNWNYLAGTGGFYINCSIQHEDDTEIVLELEILADLTVSYPDKGLTTFFVNSDLDTEQKLVYS